VQIFSFAIPAIIAAFAISNAEAGLIGTATLLTSAFGGWFAGALSDRFGRVRTLQITIAWFAVFTFLCGFAQTYTQSVDRYLRRHRLRHPRHGGTAAAGDQGARAHDRSRLMAARQTAL
jgi:MFS family permease